MNLNLNIKDEMTMKLVHYFVVEENYQPMIVRGVDNEIWLENIDADYKIVRINQNHIFNDEQYNLDISKIKNITKQIRKKTLSFKVPTLNILLDLNDGVKAKKSKNVETLDVSDIDDIIKDNKLKELFPKLPAFLVTDKSSPDLFMGLTNDINQKATKDNKVYEEIFNPKKIIITPILILLNVLFFIITMSNANLFNLFLLDPGAVKSGEIWRILTSMFMHGDIIHLFVNMYSLSIIGPQIESFAGKVKYLFIYVFSGITASLLSIVITNSYSVGASGAIFGLLGSLTYFAYNYRIYFATFLKTQILPVIGINLFIGFTHPAIDNAAHVGGLIGGIMLSMISKVSMKEDKIVWINSIISYIILIAFLIYLIAK